MPLDSKDTIRNEYVEKNKKYILFLREITEKCEMGVEKKLIIPNIMIANGRITIR